MNDAQNLSVEDLVRVVFKISGATEQEVEQGALVAREFLHRKALDILVDGLSEPEKTEMRNEMKDISENDEVYSLMKKRFSEQKVIEALRIATNDFSKTFLKELIGGFADDQKTKLQDELSRLKNS